MVQIPMWARIFHSLLSFRSLHLEVPDTIEINDEKPGGGVVTCHDFGYGRAVGVPGPHPIHILGKFKKHTHSYASHSENCSHSYTLFQILPIHILFGC